MTIYTAPPARTDTFAVGAEPLVEALSWTAVQVIVDNPTTWWLYLPTARRFVAPGVMGAVIPFPGSTQVQAQWQAPVGYTLPAPTAGQEATLVWLSPDIEVAPHPGIATVTSQQQVVLESVIAPAGGSTTVPVTVPSGTLAIGFAVRSEAIPNAPGHFYATPQLVSIIGDQTDLEYFATTAATSTSVLAVPFDSSDITVAVDLRAAAGEQSKIDVLAWPIALGVAIRQNPGDPPIGVSLEDPAGNALFTDSGGNQGVTLVAAGAAPWQVVNRNGLIGTGGIAAGATLTVIAAGGASVDTRLRKVEFEVVAAAGSILQIECPAGTGRAVVNGAVGQRVNLDWDYFDCGLNAAVAIHNTGALSGAVNGHATANQT